MFEDGARVRIEGSWRRYVVTMYATIRCATEGRVPFRIKISIDETTFVANPKRCMNERVPDPSPLEAEEGLRRSLGKSGLSISGTTATLLCERVEGTSTDAIAERFTRSTTAHGWQSVRVRRIRVVETAVSAAQAS